MTATVRGTRDYQITLGMEDEHLSFSCTCPVGDDGLFCKHSVAVALAYQAAQRPAPGIPSPSDRPTATMDDVRKDLSGLDKEALVNLLIEQAHHDGRLRDRLLMKSARRRAKGLNLAPFRRAIDGAVSASGYVDYHAAHAYAEGIEEVIKTIEDLLKEGYAAEVIELAEYALRAVEDAIGSVDDADGHMGEILERLQVLHLAACRKARPDPEALAERLFEWELRTEWDTFYGAAGTYAKVLGEKGLAVYRKLAGALWTRVPSLKPGSRQGDSCESRRFRLTHIMETLARQSGDVEALVAVKKRDLSTAYAFLDIAETYRKARKRNLALEWAEKGFRAFPERTDPRLREFLAREYHKRSRPDDAMTLVWLNFTDPPCLAGYQALKAHADKVGQWTSWRDKALGVFREEIAKAKRQASRSRWMWPGEGDHSELVRVFLWEKDVDAAWREARQGGCSTALWLELAATREQVHPEDALFVYRNQVEPTLARKNNEAYREAIGLLYKIQRLMARLGRREDFSSFVAVLRVAHKPKRNFMKLLDAAKWT